MFQLLPGLNKQVFTRRNPDGNALSSVSRPDVKAGVARAAMDSQEIEIRMESSQNGILFAIFNQVGRCRGQ